MVFFDYCFFDQVVLLFYIKIQQIHIVDYELLNDEFPKLKFLKGSYFKLSSKWKDKFKKLIYPLPDMKHGSLGIHLTIDRDGMARLGPNADWIDNRQEDYEVDNALNEVFYEEGKKYIPDLELNELTADY